MAPGAHADDRRADVVRVRFGDRPVPVGLGEIARDERERALGGATVRLASGRVGEPRERGADAGGSVREADELSCVAG